MVKNLARALVVFLLVALTVLTISACKKHNPITPTPNPVMVGVVVVNGASLAPVIGASVEFTVLKPGQKFTTGSDGKATAELVLPNGGTSVQVDAGGYLTMYAFWDGTSQLKLWPLGPNGAEYIHEFAFKGFNITFPRILAGTMARVDSDVSVIVSEPFLSDADSMTAFRHAADVINTNGRFVFRIITDGQAIPGTVTVTMKLSPGITSGTARGSWNSDYVQVGSPEISFGSTGFAKVSALYEFGHVLGLSDTHTETSFMAKVRSTLEPSQEDLMALKMFVRRAPGTTWPDKDPKFGSQ